MENVTIVKVGGNVIDDNQSLQSFLKSFSEIPGKKVLIHGGGKKATEIATRMGVQTEMKNGRRITNEQMLDIAVMVYAGLINKKLVVQLNSFGLKSIGLTGADLNLIPSRKRKNFGIDYGFVGVPVQEKFASEELKHILEADITPVFSAITYDLDSSSLLNTNADTIASTIAVGLSSIYKVTLIYAFEKNGVLSDPENDETVISSINPQSYDQLKTENIIKDGMIPKLDNSFAAINKGVEQVVICKSASIKEFFAGSFSGTVLTK